MSGAKTEAPTARRLRELRRKGEVPYSAVATRTGALLGALLGLAAVGPTLAQGLGDLFRWSLVAGASPMEALHLGARLFAVGTLACAGSAALGGITAGALQTGFLIAPRRLLPEAQRFTPGRTWRDRLRADSWLNATIAGFAALGILIVGGVALRLWAEAADEVVNAALTEGLPAALRRATDAVAATVGAWVGISCLVALTDATWQRQRFLDRHKMSLQEIRDEYKRSEGDPEHKARRARAHRELLATDLRGGVGRADVILRNPSHVAIGLRYRREELDAPIVTVSGSGERARQIVREARRRRVPEYHDAPTARALVDLDVDASVPPALFAPIAVVFRWLETLDAEG